MTSKPANAAQKKWMSDIAEWASDEGMNVLADWDYSRGFQLHHVLGRSAKHNKVAIGHEFIIPVPIQYHDINEKNDLNVSYFKHNFTERFGKQFELFVTMYEVMRVRGYSVPSKGVLNAIMDTNA